MKIDKEDWREIAEGGGHFLGALAALPFIIIGAICRFVMDTFLIGWRNSIDESVTDCHGKGEEE